MKKEYRPLLLLLHGKESGPNGSKIRYLSEVARNLEWETLVPDMSRCVSLAERLSLVRSLKLSESRPLVFAGSSMGGHVACLLSRWERPDALFLMAPAVGLPGYTEPYPIPDVDKIVMISAVDDDVVPISNIRRFRDMLPLDRRCIEVRDDHRLSSSETLLREEMRRLLSSF